MPSSTNTRGPVDRAAAAAAIDAFVRALGLDPAAHHDVAGTGARVADAFIDELTSGYDVDPVALLTLASIDVDASAAPAAGAGRGVVVVRGIDVATTCPHHLMPAIGTADVAFAPAKKLVGVGAIAALVQTSARRLVLQESLGEGVVTAIDAALAPAWCACRIELAHGCMIARGERGHASRARVETFAVRGAITHEAMMATLGHGGASAR